MILIYITVKLSTITRAFCITYMLNACLFIFIKHHNILLIIKSHKISWETAPELSS